MAYLMNGSAFFLTRRRVSRSKKARKTRRCWPNSDCRPITSFIRRSFGATRITCGSYAHPAPQTEVQFAPARCLHRFRSRERKLYPATGANAAAGRSGIFSRPRLASGFAGLVSKRFRSLLSESFRAPEFTAVGSIRIGLSCDCCRYTRRKTRVGRRSHARKSGERVRNCRSTQICSQR